MKFKLFITIGTSIALLMPLGAQATAITNIAISGTGSYSIYELPNPPVVGPQILQLVSSPTLADVNDILMFNNRVGNVQLGNPLAPTLQTNMTVTFTGGSQATLSNLLIADWTDNGDALVKSYITAAGQSVGISLNTAQMTQAVTKFLTVWQLASDPSIAIINLVDGHVIVGQDGLPSPQVAAYLTTLLGVVAPPQSLASEVVKVSYNGSTQYLYSFTGTLNGYSASDGFSYKERYTAQTIPEPTTLLLLGVGFMGLGYMRRHNKRN